MKGATILLTPIVTGVVGYRIGLWWLDRTVTAAELETAVYPAVGAVAGGVVGLIVAAVVALALRTPRADRA